MGNFVRMQFKATLTAKGIVDTGPPPQHNDGFEGCAFWGLLAASLLSVVSFLFPFYFDEVIDYFDNNIHDMHTSV